MKRDIISAHLLYKETCPDLTPLQTVNFMGRIEPGQTYINQYFAVTGKLRDSTNIAKHLINTTYQDIMAPNELQSTDLSIVFSDKEFAVLVGSNRTCDAAPNSCVGFSTPRNGSSAFFLVTCGNGTYIGPDQYHFAEREDNDKDASIKIRPYVCDGFSDNVRPTWRLLGYFDQDACTLDSLEFNSTLCQRNNGI